MNQETLQQLVGVHNTLYNMTVTGDSVVPMAQVLVALQKIIADNGQAISGEPRCSNSVSEVQ